ncbi:hypothetical protein LUZ61_015732 [Rhynchospora tenuis]|uniref:F-box domain-containing protein n=1 Tax=Rhynchospora tenuis TaxID=198213 RepID=A0AAD6EJ66_9POAL|nr:hypothetical protein LUZ61_015732 [Rhynchospora tenuis]
MAAWSDLTNDLLLHIITFLPLSDHYRFGAVCKNWRSVSKLRQHLPTPELPWLVLEEESETRRRKFYSLSEAKHHSIDIPKLHGCCICGSSHGWLFAVDIKITGILVNPFTQECYELPPFPAFSKDVDVTTLIEKEKVPSGSTGLRDYTLEEMQTIMVSKAILSHDPKERSDFMVMILFGDRNAPAIWRPGDALWTVIEGPKYVIMDDIIYFKENFYVLSALNVLYVVDFNPKPKLIEVGPQIKIEGCFWQPWQRYLVDFNGNLLLIERFCQRLDKELFMTSAINVAELNLEENCLCERFDISDFALFLGRNSSIFVNSSHFPMCKKNSIYFTESYFPFKFGCRDVGVFDMTDRTINTFYPVVFPPCVGSPIWLVPNP